MDKRNFQPDSPEKIPPRIIFVREKFFSAIEDGLKTCELRVAFRSFLQIKPGQILELKTSQNRKIIKARVVAMRQHPNLESVIEKENMNKIVPGLPRKLISRKLKDFFNEADVKAYGLVVIEFEKI